ncbi:hypothetical protein EMIHUDRAFT_100792 [Emiliania huxleyi CCMP1516]|uniref:Carbamoyltransferase C-terminal domain-containing protein n=2 Tax=Emiliania huxleyi TaxID=2903 RepID=A0A0D3JQV2_EMIH1|nr:hypothetical protein EMIHUDRAFT_100792 [Emiliania huxleyi CCMP1516]EOD25887.1 hypothetical protein EMIHUDRAFT_100792 [Emiliania huxleyi CCMP1516]|eukprot:XP_005778316.1 hypothetical protein EMIHUDRAFT_100792 [Emiliania huxleyi CCMP1516]
MPPLFTSRFPFGLKGPLPKGPSRFVMTATTFRAPFLRPRSTAASGGTAFHQLQEAAPEEYAGFVEAEWLTEAAAIERAAASLAAGEILALWASGGAKYGPRALGRRSIVADPRNAAAVDRLNRLVKKREPFRPFAPSVGGEADPRWRALIAAFFALTGVPLVLNTSFNTRPAEPIVEGPANALAAFLHVASEASGGEAVSGGEAASGAGGSAQGGAARRAARDAAPGRAPGGGEEWADGAAGEWLAADGDAAAAETFTPDAPREAREHRSTAAWVELGDELKLAALELSDGAEVADIAQALDAPPDEVAAALRSLWKRRFVALE